MVTCPPLLVAPPPTTPFVGGLFAAARFPELPADGDNRRWECGGVEYQAETCAKPTGWTEVCPPGTPESKVPTLNFPMVSGIPFTVLLGVECKLVGYSLEEFERRVVNAFTLCEQGSVEDIFWTGSTPDPADPAAPRLPLGNNSLAGTVAAPSECELVGGGSVDNPLSIVSGVAALEGYMRRNYCGTPVIHAPVEVASYAASMNLMCECGTPNVRTPIGTRWAFGGGYFANTGPDGVAAPDGVAWLYATGQVNIWRSEVWVNPDDLRYAFNTRTNDVTVFAERKYAISWECACAAVPVSLGCQC